MQAVNSILGTTTFGDPGGTHVTIGSDGAVTGYYSDGRKAYDLVPGTQAAITTYTDVASSFPQTALTKGNLVFTPRVIGGTFDQITLLSQPIVKDSNVLVFTANSTTVNNANMGLAVTNNTAIDALAWEDQSTLVLTPGAQWATSAIGGATVQPGIARLNANDRVEVVGCFNATATFATTSTIATLTQTFRPGFVYRTGVDVYSSTGVWKGRAGIIVNTNGGIQTNGFSYTSGDIIGLDISFPRE